MIHTRVHTYATFANPYLVCGRCHHPVPRWHNNDRCSCAAQSWNYPCGHNAEVVSACPSWSPVDGCTCAEQLGIVSHRSGVR